MKKRLLLAGATLGTLLLGQDTGDRVTVPFRDPSKPRTLAVTVMNGGMTVRGYDGKDAIIEANPRGGERPRRGRPQNVPAGMKRVDNTSTGLDIVEDNNVIKITGGMAHSGDSACQ